MSLLLQLTIFLAAALIFVPLAKQLGVPTILGYLGAGILLGPSFLNIASDSDTALSITEFGIIVLLFLLGLELRPQRLREIGRSSAMMGGMQVLITGLALTLLSIFVFKQSLSNSLLIGLALALSSSVFVLQLLTEKQHVNTPHGQSSLSILFIQNITALPILAIIPLIAGLQTIHHGIAYFAALIATFTGLFLFSRYLLQHFFQLVARSGARELIIAVAVFILFIVLLVMNFFGISLALGALLTGILLADSAFRYELKANIAPFKGLLFGIFFIALGMSVNISLIVEMPWVILGGVLGLIILKLGILTVIARYHRFDWKNSLRIGITLSQGGEFAFVILTVAVTEHALSQVVAAPVILIVVLSMALTPVLYWLMTTQLIPRLFKAKESLNPDASSFHHPIIIAGFGRFGQIIARILSLDQHSFTVIDTNPQLVDVVKPYGGSLSAGDLTHANVLHAAGIEHAKIFILAIHDVEDSMNVARYLCLNYPHVKLFVRARDRHHAALLHDLGIRSIWRETYLSSLGMAYHVLCDLGLSAQQAYQQVEDFRAHDETVLASQYSNDSERQRTVDTRLDLPAQLESLFQGDHHHQQTQLNSKPKKDEDKFRSDST